MSSSESVDANLTIDECGNPCPAPVIALARAAREISETENASGFKIAVLSDDPAAAYDIPAWCRMKNATYLGVTNINNISRYLVQL